VYGNRRIECRVNVKILRAMERMSMWRMGGGDSIASPCALAVDHEKSQLPDWAKQSLELRVLAT